MRPCPNCGARGSEQWLPYCSDRCQEIGGQRVGVATYRMAAWCVAVLSADDGIEIEVVANTLGCEREAAAKALHAATARGLVRRLDRGRYAQAGG